MPVRIKICGITNLEDALAAVAAGADALGFIFFPPSPRSIAPEKAAEILRALPPLVTAVGVFVNEPPEVIAAILKRAGLGIAQLHGHESPEICSAVPARVIKAFRVQDESTLRALPAFHVSAFLLDSFVAGQFGGTGAKFNWDLAIQAQELGTPVILAGGLTPENIAQAVAQVRPYAVDVYSGVELNPRQKDHQKIREFIARARAAG